MAVGDYLDSGPQAHQTEACATDGMDYGRWLSKARLGQLCSALHEFENAVQEVATSDKQPPHCMAIAGRLGFLGPDETKSTEDVVAGQCRARFGESAEFDAGPQGADKPSTLHVILDSLGGSLDAAYKAVLYLRRFVKTIKVYVPRQVKSAAMLIAIGADEIVMSPLAELGPLDTQLQDPKNPVAFSVLDCYQSVDYVREFGIRTLPMAMRELLSGVPLAVQSRTPSDKFVAQSVDFALGNVEPMLRNVKALDFGSWGRTLKIGEVFAYNLLTRLKDQRGEERVAKRIARQLVYGYTHHPFPIDDEEALRIGLLVTPMSFRMHRAALAVAEACNRSRFVGFPETADELWAQAEEDVPDRRGIQQEYGGYLGHVGYQVVGNVGEAPSPPDRPGPDGANDPEDERSSDLGDSEDSG